MLGLLDADTGADALTIRSAEIEALVNEQIRRNTAATTRVVGYDEAIAAGAHAVLLDNMSPDLVRAAVERAGGKVVLEASGGIDLTTIRSFAETGVDLVSVGALTHSAPAIDLALEVEN